VADRCINAGGTGEKCISSHTAADLALEYRIPQLPGVALPLGVTNLSTRCTARLPERRRSAGWRC
jgi:hypothetical protein